MAIFKPEMAPGFLEKVDSGGRKGKFESWTSVDFCPSERYLSTTWPFGQIAKELPVSKIPDIYHRQAEILKALAHPTRLFVTSLLSKGPLCVCEITERIGDDVSTVSKHLSIMRSAGIVSSEKKGLQVIYRLETPCVTKFFSCTLNVIKSKNADQTRVLALTRP